MYLLPASSVQRRLWFLEQWQSGEPVYNTPVAYRLTGTLDRCALERSLHEIAVRHETFRTSFATEHGTLVQRVNPEAHLPLAVCDLESRMDREAELARLLREEARRPFDLEHGPLVRASLFRMAADDHVLCVVVHHIVFDASSESVLLHELQELYTSFHDGRPSPLPELPIQYGDYAAWVDEQRTSEALESQLAYWKERLAGLGALELPVDRPRPKLQSYRGAEIPIRLEPPLAAALAALARQERVTVYMTLAAAFHALLHRYSGQCDLATGFLVWGRDRSELEGLIGCFVNTLTLRGDLSGDPTFRELLARTRESAVGAYAHQDVPFDQVVEGTPQRDLSRSPLFQVLFNQAPAPKQDRLGDLTVRRIRVDVGIAKFDLSLTLSADEQGDGLDGWLEYNTDLFDAATIHRFFGHYVALLEGAVANQDAHISALPLLSEAERDQQWEWNATGAAVTEARVDELVARQAARVPDRVAVQFEDESITYRELEQRARRLAEQLRAGGIGCGMRVGLFMERSIDMVVGLLGIMKTGAAYVPMDPAFPAARLAMMLEDSGAALILTHAPVAHLVPSRAVPVRRIEDDGADSQPRMVPSVSVRVPESRIPQTDRRVDVDLAYVIYTSGSTGKPKGVAVTQRSLVNLLESMAREPGIAASDVLLSVTTLSFDIAGLELFLPLVTGAPVTLVSRDEALDGVRLLQRLASSGATIMQATPATWRLLLEAGWTGRTGLRVLCGGEALPRDLASALLERAAEVWNVYGPTETTIWSSAWRVQADDGPIAIGRPIANTQLWVLDARLQPVPVGVIGELYIGGMGVSPGYWNQPDLTSERFVPDPFAPDPGARLFRTGDLARRLTDGRLVCLGRIDHQVKLRGFRIELGEIETAIAQHPSVRAVVAAVREGAGGAAAGDARLVAYVVAEQSEDLAEQLRTLARMSMPEYMVPSTFVFLDALPLTPNGKVDRRALPAPGAPDPLPSAQVLAPRTPTEAMVVRAFVEVLGAETIGVRDDFFDLGGHSMLAARLMTRLRAASGQNIPLRTLFERPTPEGLAAFIDEIAVVADARTRADALARQQRAIVPLQPEGTQIPVFAVAGHGGDPFTFRALAQHLGEDQPFFGLQPPGLDGDSAPLTSIVELATYFAGQIRAFQSPGPVVVAGYCAGGSTALELAVQLQEHGFDVRLLALFGCPYPSVYRFMAARFYCRRAMMHLRTIGSLSLADGGRHVAAVARTVASMLRSPSSLRRTEPPPAPDEWSQMRGRVERATIAAARCYTPRPFAGRLALFFPNHEWVRAGFQARRWASMARSTEEYFGPEGCDHDTMLREPTAAEFSELFAHARDQMPPSAIEDAEPAELLAELLVK